MGRRAALAFAGRRPALLALSEAGGWEPADDPPAPWSMEPTCLCARLPGQYEWPDEVVDCTVLVRSVLTQGDHRVNLSRPASGEEAGGYRNNRHERDSDRQRRGIARLDAEQERAEKMHRGERESNAAGDAHGQQRQHVEHDEPHNGLRCCAERHANAELGAALRDEVVESAEQADRR